MYDMQPRTRLRKGDTAQQQFVQFIIFITFCVLEVFYSAFFLLLLFPLQIVSSECTSGQAKSTIILFGLVTSAKPTQMVKLGWER